MILPPSPTGEIWLAKIAVEAVLIGLLFHRKLAARYAGLTTYLIVAVVKSSALLWQMQSGNYYSAFRQLHWITLAAQAAWVLDTLIIVTGHFRGMRSFAIAIYATFATVSALCAVAISGYGRHWWSPELQAVAQHWKQYGAWLFGVLLLTQIFCWLYRGKVRLSSNARAVLTGAMVLLFSEATGAAVKRVITSDACSVAAPLVVFLWLAWRMRESGEYDAVIPPPATPEDLERWRRENMERERQLLEKARLIRKL